MRTESQPMKKSLGTLLSGVVGILLQCAAAAASPTHPDTSSAGSIDARTRDDVLGALAKELESRYAIEDTAKKLAATVRAKQKSNAYKNITSGPELARALTVDLAAVAHDKHLRVIFNFTPVPPPGPPSPQLLDQMRKLNGGISQLEILDGNVGYMRVNAVPSVDTARSAVAAAFAFLHNTDALIIDNRTNGGGDPRTVALYVSYLSEGEPYLVNTFHWREGHRVEEFKTTDLGELAYGARKPVFLRDRLARSRSERRRVGRLRVPVPGRISQGFAFERGRWIARRREPARPGTRRMRRQRPGASLDSPPGSNQKCNVMTSRPVALAQGAVTV